MRTLTKIVLFLAFVSFFGCGKDKPAARVVVADEDDDAPARTTVAPIAPREHVDSPLYKSWSAFKKGTTVTHRTVTGSGDYQTITTTTSTLAELSDEHAVVETQATVKRHDGTVLNNPPERFTNPRRIPLAPGVKKEDFGKAGQIDEGEATLDVGGKTYKTKWTKSKDRIESGAVFSTTWTCDEVPGGIVKSITEVPAIGKKTTVELVEVKTP